MIGLIIIAVLLVIAADAVRARAKLRLRANATHGARRRHELNDGDSRVGWHSLEDAHERGEAAQVEDNRFAGLEHIVSNNARRRGASLR